MWVLIVVFAHLSLTRGDATSITTQEFSSEATCRAAKSVVESDTAPVAVMNDEMQNEYKAGTHEATTMFVKVECVKK
jgi:hypothetical protein